MSWYLEPPLLTYTHTNTHTYKNVFLKKRFYFSSPWSQPIRKSSEVKQHSIHTVTSSLPLMTCPAPKVNSNGWLRGILLSNSVPSSSVPYSTSSHSVKGSMAKFLQCSAWRACLLILTSCRTSLASSSLRSSAPGPSLRPAAALLPRVTELRRWPSSLRRLAYAHAQIGRRSHVFLSRNRGILGRTERIRRYSDTLG